MSSPHRDYKDCAAEARIRKLVTSWVEIPSRPRIYSSLTTCTSPFEQCRPQADRPEHQPPRLWRCHPRIRLQSTENYTSQQGHKAAEVQKTNSVWETNSVNIDEPKFIHLDFTQTSATGVVIIWAVRRGDTGSTPCCEIIMNCRIYTYYLHIRTHCFLRSLGACVHV